MNKILSRSQQLLFTTYQKCLLHPKIGCQNFSTLLSNANTVLSERRTQPSNCAIQFKQNRNIQVFVKDKKGGYRTGKDVSTKEHILDGLKELKKEIVLWKDEIKQQLTEDPLMVYRPGKHVTFGIKFHGVFIMLTFLYILFFYSKVRQT